MGDDDFARAWEVARLAWPAFEVGKDEFARFLGKLRDAEGDLSSRNVSDLYLACACAHGEPHALGVFEARYIARVGAYLARVEGDPVMVDEVRQAVRAHVLIGADGKEARIGSYTGRGSLASWIRVVVVRLHSTMRQSSGRDTGPTREEASAPLALSPELEALRARFRPAVERALREALAGLSPRERTILSMHFASGLSLERIGELYGVHKATVSRWMSAARSRLLEVVEQRLRDIAGVPPEELRSVLRLLGSEPGLDLSGLLRADEPVAN
jgi:RNA polymerase sigma-70 factor (ECF subfamily)